MAGIFDTQIQQAYVAFFNRPADFSGLVYWNEQAIKAGGVAPVLAAFGASAEYTALYAGKSTSLIIETIYQNLFNRIAEPAAIEYWGGRLSGGTFNIGQIANAIVTGAQNEDKINIANKVTASLAFTAALDTNPEILAYETTTVAGAAAVKDWLKAVTSVSSTVPNTASVNNIVAATVVASTGTATPGQTFTLTTNLDAPNATSPSVNTLGTSGNDTYNGVIDAATAANNTLQAIDNIDGGAGIDTLSIISSGANANTVAPLFLKNVEKVSVKDVDAAAGTTVNLASATGVTEVISDASVARVDFQNIGAAALTAKNISTAGVVTAATLGTSPVTTPVVINLEKLGTEDAVGVAAVSAGRVVINDTNADNTVATINVAAGTVRIATDGNATAGTTDSAAAINLSGTDTTGLTGAPLTTAVGTHTVSALTINATGDLAVSARDSDGAANAVITQAAIQGFDTTKAGSITVNGAGKVDMGLLAGAVKTVNASAATGNVTFTGSTYTGTAAGVTAGLTVTTGTGNDSVTLSGVATASANTGAGNDSVIVVGGTLTAGAVLNGGDGSDALVLNSADAVAAGATTTAGAALRATYSNFETLSISNALGDQLEAGRLGFGSSVAFNTALTAGGQTINGLVNGATLSFRAGADNSSVYTATVTDAATLTDDTLNLNLAANLLSNDNHDVRVAINGVNNVVVNANDRVNNVVDDNLAANAADNGASEGYTLFLTNAASLNTVTVNGTSQFIYAADAGSTALKTINATASTGNNTLDVAAFVGLERVTVNAGNGVNTINGSNTTFGDALNGGTGRDTFTAGRGADALKGNGGRDTFNVTTAGAGSDSIATGAGADKISDFGTVSTAITAATNGALAIATFAADTTAPGGANVDAINLTVTDATSVTVPTLGGLAADVNVNNNGLQGAAGTDIVAGDLITSSETAKGVITLAGAAAAKVDTLVEWIAVANTMAATQGDVVAFTFSGNTYLFQQGDGVVLQGNAGVADVLIEMTGVTGLGGTVGITVVGTNTAAAVGDILVG